jgi:hypothetical protein
MRAQRKAEPEAGEGVVDCLEDAVLEPDSELAEGSRAGEIICGVGRLGWGDSEHGLAALYTAPMMSTKKKRGST